MADCFGGGIELPGNSFVAPITRNSECAARHDQSLERSLEPRRQKIKAKRILGEFLVIVVGVLVALSADRAMGLRDQLRLEQSYLDGLEADLVADSLTLEDGLAQERGRGQGAAHLLSVISDHSASDDDPRRVLLEIETLGRSLRLNYSTATWTELVSAGNLNIIRDGALRRSLAAYYEEQETVDRIEDAWERFFWLVEQMAIEAIPGPARLAVVGPLVGIAADEIRSDPDRDDVVASLAYLRGQSERESMIVQARLVAREREDYYEVLLESTTALLQEVRAAQAS